MNPSTRLALVLFASVTAATATAQAQHRHHRRHARPSGEPDALPATFVASRHDAVEDAYRPGIEAANSGHSEVALALFRAIYEQSHAPRALARMGTSEAQIGRWLDAEVHLRDALANRDDSWISSHREAIEGVLARVRTNLADLDVVCAHEGATVSIDGGPAVTLPLRAPLRVRRGTVSVEVQAPGRVARREARDLRGATERVEVTLDAVAAPPPPPVVVAVAPVASGPIPVPARRIPWRPLALTAAIAGGVSVVLGIATLSARNSSVDDFNVAFGGRCWVNNGTPLLANANGDTEQNGCTTPFDSANTLTAVAATSFALGAAFAGTSVVLLNAGRREDLERARAVSCGLGPGTVGVRCALHF